MTPDMRPIGVFHEHQEWFRPLFREMDRRGLPYRRLDARSHRYDPAEAPPPFSLVLNRMSPSAHLRGHGRAVNYTLAWLEHLERLGVRVVNGTEAFRTEISKARQLALFQTLGLAHPDTRVVDAADQVVPAAGELRFPVVVKANLGGSGAGIRRFDGPGDLERAADRGELEAGPDGTVLVQEFVPARGGHVTRVEVVGGQFLYAIDVHLSGDTFDLCPADICRTTSGEELRPGTGDDAAGVDAGSDGAGDEGGRGGAGAPGGESVGAGACASDADDAGLTVERSRPPGAIVEAVEAVAAAAGIEVGGVEYLVDDRDGTPRFYDVNALSNFVADPERVLGFDPFASLVDWLEREAVTAEHGAARGRGRSRAAGEERTRRGRAPADDRTPDWEKVR